MRKRTHRPATRLRDTFLFVLYRVLIALLGLVSMLTPLAALAQSTVKTGFVRDTDARISTEAARTIDEAVLRDLAQLAGVQEPVVAAVPYDEIQLNVGCEDETRSCLAAIADAIGVEALVLRRLRVADGIALDLVYFDQRQDKEAQIAQARSAMDQAAQLSESSPRLVRQLFGIAEPPPPPMIAQAAPASEPQRAQPALFAEPERAVPARNASVGPLTWTLLIGGTAVLAGGLVFGAIAQSEFDDFKRQPTTTLAQTEEAHDRFDQAEVKATLATVLIPVGGAALAVGATLLVLDFHHPSRTDRRPAPSCASCR